MPVISLPDGSAREFSQPVTVSEVAANIGPGLAKATLAGEVDGRLVDASYLIDRDASLKLITAKDDEGLEIIRHSTAHLLAHAVKSLFPQAEVTIGPVIENGFYYDFAFERSFTPDDLVLIDKKMHELIKENYKIERQTMSRNEAIDLFRGMGEEYKVEIIKAIPEDEVLTLYKQDDFIDLCRGPHVPRTGMLKAFKLTKLAGAYWRGDSDNAMLQRIYGTAWADKKQLTLYLERLEEAEKRDHRRLAKRMDLFHLQPEAPGLPFWHANGWTLYNTVRQYIRDNQLANDYFEINTPMIVDRRLWEKSGHWDKFSEDMFTLEAENRTYAIKPMSCPCHVQVFNQGLKSYRDLPLRLAEFGCCHRNEPSGTLHGLMRVRGMVQDDGHIFCTEDQVHHEVLVFIQQLHDIYRDFGFTDIIHKLSTRPEKRVGSDEVWDKAEAALSDALNASGVDWGVLPGEGAFYGPKIEFSLKDCLGRVWQCGTIQVDFSMPARLDAEYVGEDGNKHSPVMLHRAILGTLERFIGILLEHYAGRLPLWLAPIQVVVMNITDRQAEYAQNLVKKLKKQGIRAIYDLRNEKIGFKIREQTLALIPYHVILGDRELEQETLSLRLLDGSQESGLSQGDFIDMLVQKISAKQ